MYNVIHQFLEPSEEPKGIATAGSDFREQSIIWKVKTSGTKVRNLSNYGSVAGVSMG